MEDMNKSTLTYKVRNWLEAGNSITSYEAFVIWKATRLSAIIYTLRYTYGMNIVGEMETNPNTGKRFKRYRLV